MLIKRTDACMLLIDMQEKLMPLIPASQSLIKACTKLIWLAEELNLSLLVTQQYTKGLGSTIEDLKKVIKSRQYIEKVSFSCWREPLFQEALNKVSEQQFILIGLETHVCVLQTAMDLLEQGKDVFVVVDAVASRHKLDYSCGLKRMKQAGVHLVSTEMVFFELLEQAATPEFKTLSKEFFGHADEDR